MGLTVSGVVINALPEWRIANPAVLPIVTFWAVNNIIVFFLTCMMTLQAPVRRNEERFELDEPIWIFSAAGAEAAYRLPEITLSLVREFATRGTRHVLTHSYEGGHPDHDAVAFSVHAAGAQSASRGSRIDIIEMPFYRMGRTGRLFQSFTEDEGYGHLGFRLTGHWLALKRKMMQCYPTQYPTIAMFSAGLEKFRLAPLHDFAKLPNAGKLFYETRPWGMTGARWLNLADRAINDLVGQAAA